MDKVKNEPVTSALLTGTDTKKRRRIRPPAKRSVVKYSLVIVGSMILTLCLVCFILYQVNGFFETYRLKFQEPVIFRAPILIEKRISTVGAKTGGNRGGISKNISESGKGNIPAKNSIKSGIASISANSSEYEIVMNQKHGAVLWNIYALESSRGKNDFCRNNNLGYAGFGVLDNNRKIVCYETFAKAAERANYWFNQLHPENSLVSALCQYNLGTPALANCQYYQDFLSL